MVEYIWRWKINKFIDFGNSFENYEKNQSLRERHGSIKLLKVGINGRIKKVEKSIRFKLPSVPLYRSL